MKEQEIESPLRQKYLQLRAIDMIPIRDRIINECEITKDTFYKWLSNPEKVKKPFREKISKIFECNESEIFPNYEENN